MDEGLGSLQRFFRNTLKIHHVHWVAVKAHETEVTAARYNATNCSDSSVTSEFHCATIQK
jgi:hypothetical protein